MKKKNIFIIPSLGYGGAESFLLRLLPHMKNENIIVTLFNTQYDKKRLNNLKVKYITLDPIRSSIKNYYIFFKLLATLNKNDIIFSWLYIADLFASLIKILLFWKKINLIWNVRNTILNINQYSLASYVSYFLLKSFLRQVPNKIIFNSRESMIQHIKKGYKKENSFLIYNGFIRHASLKKVKNPKKSFDIIYVARYHKQKNHNLLFKSIKKLNEDYKFDFNLHLVGKDIDKNNKILNDTINKLKISKRIILHGVLEQTSVHELFSTCDLTLLLSKYGESFPNVLAEAMLYGTFPIATKIGEATQIVDKFGDIVPTNVTPKQISDLIYKYYLEKNNNYEQWIKRIKDCQEFSYNRFKIEKIASKFEIISDI